MALHEMTPGGVWLKNGNNEPQYVLHHSHIRRLSLEGWSACEDPRPALDAAREEQQKSEAQKQKSEEQIRQTRESELHAKIAQLEALLQQRVEETSDKQTPSSSKRKAD